jgi:hypothetical protein
MCFLEEGIYGEHGAHVDVRGVVQHGRCQQLVEPPAPIGGCANDDLVWRITARLGKKKPTMNDRRLCPARYVLFAIGLFLLLTTTSPNFNRLANNCGHKARNRSVRSYRYTVIM